MSKLEQLLAFLEREGVSEVILRQDSPPCVVVGEQVRPLSRSRLASSDLTTIVAGTPVAELLAHAAEERARRLRFDLDGKCYAAVAYTREGRLQLRFNNAGQAEALRPRSERGRPGADAANEPNAGPQGVARPAGAHAGAVRDRAGATVEHAGGACDPRLERLLSEAREARASDVHVSSGLAPQFRIAGLLAPTGPVLAGEELEEMLLGLLPPVRRTQLEQLGYTDLAVELGAAGRLRLNVNRQRGGIKGCFRLVDTSPATLEELGLPLELKKVSMHHQGLVVISGPNGSGKTTTLAALVELFNSSRPIHIITVEDPVEILHARKRAIVTQREVGSHTRSFAAALKGALREDPDVIAIGELRDIETVEMALSAAETGHLVVATMSTPSGARTIDRLIDMFPPSVQSQVRATLAGTLKMVISQRLVPSVDRRSRHAAAELITGNIPLWAMIRDNKLYQLPSLLQRGRAYGMVRIDDSLNELVARGRIAVDVARTFADDPRAIIAPGERPAAQPVAPAAPEGADRRGAFGNLFGKRGG